MKRSELKQLVKECLLEILTEGLKSPVTETRVVSKPQQTSPQKQQVEINKNKVLESAVREVAGNDSVLAEVLADTAATTLQRQLNASRDDAPVAARLGVQSDPTTEGVDLSAFDIPSDQHWAELAFSAKKI